MSTKESVSRLDDRQVTLALQHLGWDLLPSSAQVNGFADPEEGLRLVRAFLDHVEGSQPDERGGDAELDSTEPDSTEPDIDPGRNALLIALAMPETTELATELVDDPPDDDQMSWGELPQYIAVVGFVVALLQTRFAVRISRREGRTEFDFGAGKDALEGEQLSEFISMAATIVGSPPGN
jgi:hypothetical protein